MVNMRKKLKEDPSKLQAYLDKDRIRKKLQQEKTRSTEELAAVMRKERDRIRIYREEKRQSQGSVETASCSTTDLLSVLGKL